MKFCDQFRFRIMLSVILLGTKGRGTMYLLTIYERYVDNIRFYKAIKSIPRNAHNLEMPLKTIIFVFFSAREKRPHE